MSGKKCVLACFGLFASISLSFLLAGCGGSPAPLSISVSAATATVDGSDTTTLTATVTNDRNAAGVSWTVSGGTLSNTTTTSATFTAPAATTSSQTVTVTATSVADTTDTGTASITIPAKPTVSTTSTSLTGSVGAAFSVTLQGSGGIAPYKNWAVSNTGSALPACLTLSSAGVLTLTSGTAPTASCAGSYTGLIFTYSDSGTPTPLTAASSALTVTISAAPTITITPVLPSGAVGTAYAGSVGGAGGAGTLTYSLASGLLPPDLTLNPSTGAISGTPKSADVGPASFKITAADAFGDSSTSPTLNLTVAAAPAITFSSSTVSAGTYNVAYTASAAASGGAGALTYRISAGALPSDLGLNAATGAIGGTPSKSADVGTFNFTVKAADAYGDSNTQAYQLVVSYPAVTVTPATLPTGYIGSVYPSTTLAATGGTGVSSNYSWAVTSGALPSGLQLSSGGVLTGTPTGSTTGAINFSVTVTDTVAGIASTATPLSITIDPGITIAPIALPAGYTGSVYPPQGSSATLTASGGAGTPYTWSWTAASGSSLPPGLGIGATAGTIGGTPTVTGTYNVVVKATDSASPANSTTANLSITVNQGVTVTVPTLAAAYPGVAYTSSAFSAAGGTNAGFQWSWAAASGSSLPAGFSINSTTGVISAASPVNAGSSSAIYNAVVTATDSQGNKGTGNATIVIEANVSVATTALPGGTVGVSYSQALAASGGSGSYTTWQITTGGSSLTGIGLSLNTSTGVISGASPTNGTANFSVAVTDSQGHVSAAANLSLTVSTALTVTTASLNPLDVGQTPTQTLAAAGGSGIVADYSWSWTAQAGSSLPPGLTLSAGGALQGSPTTAGTYNVTLKVTDSGSSTSATANLSLTVYGALSLPASSTLPAGYTGIGYSGTLAGSGGSGGYCYTVPTLAAAANGIWDGLSTALPSSSSCGGTTAPTNYGFYAGSSLAIGGTPTNPPAPPYTIAFNMTLIDLTTGASITRPYSISVTAPAAPSLPTPSSSVPGAATVSQNFNGSITTTGGVGPNYTWTVNSSALSNNNSVSIGDGLSVVTTGNSVLSITGSPTSVSNSPGVQFSASVKDNASGLTSGSAATYTILVNPAGSTVSGTVSVNNLCGSSVTLPTFTVGLYNGATLVQSATTGNNGTYTFTSIPDGTYTITPSIPGASSSLFYPANYAGVALSTASNNSVTGENFNAEVGYTVSGTVSYSGSQTGQTYLYLNNNNCGGQGGPGTSISGTGTYTIRGVPPGSYTVQAWMDSLGQGVPNAIDPTGSISLTVTDANVGSVAVSMSNPTFATPAENPTISGIVPNNAPGVLIEYSKSENSNGVQDANEYTVEWSTSPTLGGGSGGYQFATVTGSYTFTAQGSNNVFVLSNTLFNAGLSNGKSTGSGFISGTTYYFQARSFDTLASTTHPTGWCNYTSSGCSGTSGFTGVTIGAIPCTGSCTAVSGSVTIPSSITPITGPLYLGLVQISSGGKGPSAIYITEIASPSSGANDFTVTVPGGSDYAVVGILDQDNNGGFGAGAISNTNNLKQGNLTISGSTQTVTGITLPTANSTATVATEYYSSTCQGCGSTSTSYSLNFEVEESDKLPVAVVLNLGPNLLNNNGTVALDMSNCNSCGNPQFDYSVSLPGGTPNLGDSYGFTVTYSDGSQDTGTTVSGAVTAFGSTGAVVGASDLATNLSPSGNSSSGLTPTFTWTWPTGANTASYTYSFYLSSEISCTGNNCNTVWQVPSDNSNSSGFTYAEDQGSPYGGTSTTGSLVWNTDPSGSGSTPTGSLSSNDQYNWSIQVKDSSGNQADATTWYQP